MSKTINNSFRLFNVLKLTIKSIVGNIYIYIYEIGESIKYTGGNRI